MAVTTKTIKKTGGDYSTVASWEAAAPSLGTDIWKGVISDNEEYNESVIMSAAGTPSITSYLWLTTDPANRHSGVAGTGHGRIRASDGNHVLTVSTDYTRIDWLEIQQDGSGSSDEAIRIGNNTQTVLVSYCILWTDTGTADQDGIHIPQGGNGGVSVDNCILYGWRRTGFFLHQPNSVAVRTNIINIDHCSFYDIGATSEPYSAAVFIRSANGSHTITISLYNVWAGSIQGGYEAFADGSLFETRNTPSGTVTWNGSNNSKGYTGTADIDGTNNITSWQEATDGVVAVSKSTGSWIVVNNITASSEDLTLLDSAAGNLVAGNGVDRQGSEPDSRQDFSIDITGGYRSKSRVDIGAHNVSGYQPFTGRRRNSTLVRM